MAASFRERVGERIRDARKAKGLTQAQVARLLPGTTHPTEVSRWERGEVLPQTPTLEALAKALDRDPSYFLVPEPTTGSGDLMGALGDGDGHDRRMAELLAQQNANLERQTEVLEELRGAVKQLGSAQRDLYQRMDALAESMAALAEELVAVRQDRPGRQQAA